MHNRSVLMVVMAVSAGGAIHCSEHSFTSPDYGTESTEGTEDVGTETEMDSDSDADTDGDTATEDESDVRFDLAMLRSGSADFEQTDDENGLVVIEVEDFTLLVESDDGSSWQSAYEPVDYTGTSAMQALPLGYVENKELSYAQKHAPIMVYTVDFVSTDPIYVWGRASHLDGFDDSVWFGKDGKIEGTSPLTYWDTEQGFVNMWYYIRYLMVGGPAILEVPEVGIHTFELYMREPGFLIDKIVLTTNPEFDPRSLDGEPAVAE